MILDANRIMIVPILRPVVMLLVSTLVLKAIHVLEQLNAQHLAIEQFVLVRWILSEILSSTATVNHYQALAAEVTTNVQSTQHASISAAKTHALRLTLALIMLNVEFHIIDLCATVHQIISEILRNSAINVSF
jgi:hypothetical protein